VDVTDRCVGIVGPIVTSMDPRNKVVGPRQGQHPADWPVPQAALDEGRSNASLRKNLNIDA